jgi:hypothetical protein
MTQKGKTTYYHSMVASAVVRPGGAEVLPLVRDMIRNGDKPAGGEKDGQETGKESYEKHTKIRFVSRTASGMRQNSWWKGVGNTAKH